MSATKKSIDKRRADVISQQNDWHNRAAASPVGFQKRRQRRLRLMPLLYGFAMKQYAILYRNRPTYRGMDAFLVHPERWENKQQRRAERGSPVATHHSLDEAMIMSLDEAVEMSYRVPFLDDGHLVACVVEIVERAVQTRREVVPAV